MPARERIPDNAIQTVEWWVMRVWTRWVDGRRYRVRYDDCSVAVQIAVDAGIALGKLVVVSAADDGQRIICEPVEVFDGIEGQLNAEARRAKESRAHPHEEFRVVMNADV